MNMENVEENFFLNNISMDRVFKIVEQTDYLFIYNIKQCLKDSEIEDGVYLSTLAEKMELSITDVSKAVKKLEDKGYVMWKLDENRKRTYIVLTNKAEKLGLEQKRKLIDTYEKITENIRKEDMEVTMLTLNKIKNILKDVS
ncbi:MAG: winged helix DNA-binding protein [Agathobacter sp.]|nr:winged helix DNA-binding protein [Agathobacter sp.]